MKRSAFTLIELLVVIAIIAIMAAILAPVFIRAKQKAQWAHRMDQIKNGEVRVTDDDLARMTPDQRATYVPKAGSPQSSLDVVKLRITLSDGSWKEIDVEVPKGKSVQSVTTVGQPEAPLPPADGSNLMVPSSG